MMELVTQSEAGKLQAGFQWEQAGVGTGCSVAVSLLSTHCLCAKDALKSFAQTLCWFVAKLVCGRDRRSLLFLRKLGALL